MKITIDTKTGEIKAGRKLYEELTDGVKHSVMKTLERFRKSKPMSDYEEDSMWMSYRYCIGRHTIAAHQRASDIARECYGRMSDERSIFTAYDINREIENQFRVGVGGPEFHFPSTSGNRIYTSALDIYFQFLEDFNIKSKEDLLRNPKVVQVIPTDNERGYKFETMTYEECASMCADATGDTLRSKTVDYFFMSGVQDLMIWNDLVHLFDKEHHHKSILKDGTEVEWFWTYVQGSTQHEDGKWYADDFKYERVRVPVDKWNGIRTVWIPDESIEKDLY